MIGVSTSIGIERPADEVLASVVEFPTDPRWQHGRVSAPVELESGPGFRLAGPLPTRLAERTVHRDLPVRRAALGRTARQR